MNSVFHFGIYVLSGVCFWKWTVVCFGLYLWLGRGGAVSLKAMLRYKLAAVLAIASIYYADNKIWYNPQIGVSWFDTRLTQSYLIYAVGESGKKYLVDPNYFAPHAIHLVQGHLCYLGKVRSVTAIYGTTGSFATMKRLQEADSPDVAWKMLKRGRLCTGGRYARWKKWTTSLITRTFSNINRHGQRHEWLEWVGRPAHLQVHTQPPADGELFDEQERVQTVELWHEPVFWQGGQLHRQPATLAAEIPIPQ